MLRRCLGPVVVCCLALFSELSGASAQSGGAEFMPAAAATQDSSEYDNFVAQALQAYDGGRFAEARSLFRRAHEIQPTARTLRTIGMCSFNLGDYLDAVQNLDAALNEPRKPLSAEQRTHAADLIAQSQNYVGRFRVRVSPTDAVLWVDGRPPPRLVSGELLLDPGRHELLAQASGYQPSRSTLQVEGGDRTTLDFRLEREQGAPAVVAASTPETTTEAPSPAPAEATSQPLEASHSNTQAVLGYVALGVGGASLVGFGITTGLASAKKSRLETHCPKRECGPAYHDDVDSYDRYKLLSTVSLIGTVAFVGTGVLLLVTQPDHRSERAGLTPLLGLGTIGVRGAL